MRVKYALVLHRALRGSAMLQLGPDLHCVSVLCGSVLVYS